MFRVFLLACVFAILSGITGCGTPSAGLPDRAPVFQVEEAPDPTCPPVGVASDTPPEPITDGSYRDGSHYDC